MKVKGSPGSQVVVGRLGLKAGLEFGCSTKTFGWKLKKEDYYTQKVAKLKSWCFLLLGSQHVKLCSVQEALRVTDQEPQWCSLGIGKQEGKVLIYWISYSVPRKQKTHFGLFTQPVV